MHVDGNSTTVVTNRDGLVRMNRHEDLVAVAGEGLVDRVVDDLEDHVVQTRAVIGVTDVHSGAFSDSFEAF